MIFNNYEGRGMCVRNGKRTADNYMQVIKYRSDVTPEFKGAFITIGNFDGVHLGHRHVFQRLIQSARAAERKALLVTFVPHPKMVMHPERRPFYLLTTLEERIKLLEEMQLDAVILIPFTLQYAATTAEEFIKGFLWERLRVRKIFIGHDYKFGQGQAGNRDMLTAWGQKLDFEVEVINAFSCGDIVISSTRIRKLILAGDVRQAAVLLGRPYNVGGSVVAGKGRGSSLGFPTANIKPLKELLPAKGVYAALVNLKEKQYQAVLNIGLNPTFGDVDLSLEVHLMGFPPENIYGQSLDVLFIDRIREECRFSSPEELVVQIRQDTEQAGAILKHYYDHLID
jgi:riboflavin kinase/FMN adenylyltransferase